MSPVDLVSGAENFVLAHNLNTVWSRLNNPFTANEAGVVIECWFVFADRGPFPILYLLGKMRLRCAVPVFQSGFWFRTVFFLFFQELFFASFEEWKKNFLTRTLLYNMIIGRNDLVKECDTSCEK